MDKEKVAGVLIEIGVLLELKGENPFKTRAYANAARILENLAEPLAQLVSEKRLGEIKGIGAALEQNQLADSALHDSDERRFVAHDLIFSEKTSSIKLSGAFFHSAMCN